MRRDEMLKTPAAANTMLKTMRQLFLFVVRHDLHDTGVDIEDALSLSEGIDL